MRYRWVKLGTEDTTVQQVSNLAGPQSQAEVPAESQHDGLTTKHVYCHAHWGFVRLSPSPGGEGGGGREGGRGRREGGRKGGREGGRRERREDII